MLACCLALADCFCSAQSIASPPAKMFGCPISCNVGWTRMNPSFVNASGPMVEMNPVLGRGPRADTYTWCGSKSNGWMWHACTDHHVCVQTFTISCSDTFNGSHIGDIVDIVPSNDIHTPITEGRFRSPSEAVRVSAVEKEGTGLHDRDFFILAISSDIRNFHPRRRGTYRPYISNFTSEFLEQIDVSICAVASRG